MSSAYPHAQATSAASPTTKRPNGGDVLVLPSLHPPTKMVKASVKVEVRVQVNMDLTPVGWMMLCRTASLGLSLLLCQSILTRQPS